MCVLANFEPFSPFSNFKINTLGAFYTTNVRSLSHKTHKIYIRVLHGHKYGTKYKFSNFYASNNETRCGAFLINGRWPQSTITTKIIASTFSIWINTKKAMTDELCICQTRIEMSDENAFHLQILSNFLYKLFTRRTFI